jgi:aminoglycoside phosphotransferase (APT) family kinase protein
MLIDCEVGHYGDPAFDLGFFLSHLQLKTIHLRDHSLVLAREKFCEAYRAVVAPAIGHQELQKLNDRAVMNLAACMLARVDGKSPVEYLTKEHRDEVRKFALQLLSPHRLMTNRPIQLF